MGLSLCRPVTWSDEVHGTGSNDAERRPNPKTFRLGSNVYNLADFDREQARSIALFAPTSLSSRVSPEPNPQLGKSPGYGSVSELRAEGPGARPLRAWPPRPPHPGSELVDFLHSALRGFSGQELEMLHDQTVAAMDKLVQVVGRGLSLIVAVGGKGSRTNYSGADVSFCGRRLLDKSLWT